MKALDKLIILKQGFTSSRHTRATLNLVITRDPPVRRIEKNTLYPRISSRAEFLSSLSVTARPTAASWVRYTCALVWPRFKEITRHAISLRVSSRCTYVARTLHEQHERREQEGIKRRKGREKHGRKSPPPEMDNPPLYATFLTRFLVSLFLSCARTSSLAFLFVYIYICKMYISPSQYYIRLSFNKPSCSFCFSYNMRIRSKCKKVQADRR